MAYVEQDPDEEKTSDSMLEQLQGLAEDLCKLYGFSSVQVCGCVQMQKSGNSVALFAGSGSVHERYSTTREFILRSDEMVKQQVRKNHGPD